MRPDRPNGGGLSRKNIMAEIDHSLKRLQLDYVDLYQIHRLDPHTPMEETMEALHDVVKSGKARYIGASSMYAWQFERLQNIAEKNNWTRFVSMQNHYSLIHREEEREMIPLCENRGVALIPVKIKGLDQLPGDDLTASHLVHIGGIKEIHPQFNRPLENRLGVVKISGPGKQAIFTTRFAKAHHSHTDLRHIHARITQFGIFHV